MFELQVSYSERVSNWQLFIYSLMPKFLCKQKEYSFPSELTVATLNPWTEKSIMTVKRHILRSEHEIQRYWKEKEKIQTFRPSIYLSTSWKFMFVRKIIKIEQDGNAYFFNLLHGFEIQKPSYRWFIWTIYEGLMGLFLIINASLCFRVCHVLVFLYKTWFLLGANYYGSIKACKKRNISTKNLFMMMLKSARLISRQEVPQITLKK